jgi:hypothetical protein
MIRRLSALLGAAVLLAALVGPTTVTAAKKPAATKPASITTATDHAKTKIHPKLLKQLESGSTSKISVFAVVKGDVTQARKYLSGSHVADNGDASILVGKIAVQALPKLAGLAGVVSVGPIEFSQTGKPLGAPDPELNQRQSNAQLSSALKGLYAKEVPYSKAPAIKGSNFEALKALGLLDAKTHEFADAWNAGYTGTGVTVGVMDGGTDFGHPDLVGTWKVWSGLTGSREGWNGWPKAFDPYGTLQLLSAPDQIDAGLSWYVSTTAVTCKGFADKAPQSSCSVKFATKTGPSRNFNLPAGTKSHTYQFPAGISKSGNVRLGSHPDDYLLQLFGERPAFIVADSHTAGVYDTVYVDLDDDYNFNDEKPVSKASPVSYRDMDGDGYTDLSGGLLYYISDGSTRIPGGEDAFGLADVPGPGELVAWTGDFDPGIGGHGTLTASNVVGQGVVNGKAPTFADVPGGKYPGAVIGGAPNAKLAPYGDIYFSFDFSTQFGYFLATHPTRGIDITSNSYGNSATDNDGWDAASQEADLIYDGGTVTPIFSTGNGAPGFGTTTPPKPFAGIAVGASTQFGGTGWDSLKNASQVTDNDVMVWSDRGFGATGSPGVDIVADGAYSAGDRTLNTVLSGNNAWETWGGTSRSTPVAAGATALVYQSYRQNVGAIPAGFYSTAKNILKSSAQDLGYNATIQGAGSLDAGKAVEVAAGTAASVSPHEWRVGDYRGTESEVMANIIAPGGSDTQSFAVDGPGTWTISDRQMVRTDVETFSWSSENVSKESPSNFNAPDYLIDLSARVNAHADADLMVIRANYPRAEFDANGDYAEDQAWRLLTYNWTDQNGDGNLWTDNNHNGVVNHADLATSSNIDGFADINFAASEMDKGEYARFMYHRAGTNSLMSFLRDPADLMADGIFLGLQHSKPNAAIPVTHFEFEISFYKNVDWSWLTTTPTGSGFDATVEVPEDAPYGMYEGAIVLTNGSDEIAVPVAVAVAATMPQDGDGNLTGSLEFGGDDVAADQAGLLYNNGSVFGANDWGWRAESGDWRFFFLDVPAEPAEGSLFLARTTWEGTAPYTDLDTLILGRSENDCQLFCGVFGAPYIIDTVGGSPNTNTGAGVWKFNTATGGPEDFVAAPAQEGLQGVFVHQVGWQGDDFTTPFSVTLGAASVSPAAVAIESTADTGSFNVTFTSSVDLAGLTAEAFGLSQPQSFTEPTQQDDPNDPSSASIKKDVTINHASSATFSLEVGSQDVDMFVVYDANNDGTFATSEIVASSTGGSGQDEFIQLIRPADGNYQVWAQGWSVSGTPDVTLDINVIQGNDLTISGIPAGGVAAGVPVVLTVNFSKSMTVGQTYNGELLLGPPSAPTALKVPVSITRT